MPLLLLETSRKLRAPYLFAAAFLGDMLTTMYAITVPIYANMLGATPFEIGIIGGAAGVVYTFGPYVMGRVTDRVGHVRTVTASLILSSALSFAYFASSRPTDLLLIRIFEGLSLAMLWPSVQAGIITASPSTPKALRKYNVAWGVGSMSGPLIGGALMSFMGVKTPFMAGLLLTLFFGVFGLVLLSSSENPRDQGGRRLVELSPSSQYGLKDMFLPLSGGFFYAFVIFTLQVLFPIYGTARRLTAFEIGVITFTYGGARLLSASYLIHIVKRINSNKIIILTTLFTGLSALPIWAFETTLSYYLSFILCGLSSGLLYSATLLATAEEAPSSLRGRYMGALESMLGVGFVIGPFISGAAAEIHLTAPYLVCAGMSIILASIQHVIHTRRRRHHEKRE